MTVAANKRRLAPLVADDIKRAVARLAARYESDLRRLADYDGRIPSTKESYG